MAKGHSLTVGVRIVKGRVEVDRKIVDGALRTWPDCDATLTIETEDAKRTTAANRYLWGPIYTAIHNYTGQEKEDIHDEMCARFTTKTIHYTLPTGEIVEMEVVTRTSGMTVGEFHRFVERVKLFAAEFFGLTFEDAPEEFYKERDRAAAREARRQEVA